jgi:hypothetical protein
MSSKRSVVLAGLALTVISLAAAAPAAASAAALGPAHEATARPPVSPGGPMIPGRAGRARITSPNWSGYAASGRTFSSVAATWVQPGASCSSGTQAAGFWVGFDGFTNHNVEQAGDAEVCSGGKATYYAWVEMYPAAVHRFPNPLKPGDHMRALVSYNGGSSYTLKIRDITQKWTRVAHRSSTTATRASAEVIVETPGKSTGGLYPLANFGRVTFAKAGADSSGIGTLHPTKIVMIDSAGNRMDAISNVVGNSTFSATWKRSS